MSSAEDKKKEIPEYVKMPDRKSIMEKLLGTYFNTKSENKMKISLSLLITFFIIIIVLFLIKSLFKLK